MAKITYGQDYNYFKRINISSITFGDTADIIIPFRGNPSVSIANNGTDTVEYSFNGNTLHGDLLPGASIAVNHRAISQIWLRTQTGISCNVRVEATDAGNFATASVTAASSGGGSSTVTANIGTPGTLALDASVTAISAKLGTLGQKAMVASAPVVIASDQSAVPVSGTITANIGTAGTLALDASVTAISAKLGTLG